MCTINHHFYPRRSESIPVITDLIDNIMSIPSCLQDAKSKVTLVREWIKQNPKSSPEKAAPPATQGHQKQNKQASSTFKRVQD